MDRAEDRQEGVNGPAEWSYEPDAEGLAKAVSRADKGPAFAAVTAEAVASEVHRAANDQMARSGDRLGARTFALVPMGDSKTCRFCVARSAKGFHRPKKGAQSLAKSHHHCRCKVVPGFGPDPSAEGFDPSEYREAYELGSRLEAQGYSEAQVRRAMAGEPVESLGAPSSGKGGRPRKAYTVRTIAANLFPSDRKAIEEDAARLERDLQRLWSEGKGSKKAYRETYARRIEESSIGGEITIDDFTKIEAKELQAATWLSLADMSVHFRNPNDRHRTDSENTSDIYLDGVLCDIKRITSGNVRKIKQRVLEHIERQGPEFVIDLSCTPISKGDAERAVGDLLRRPEISKIYILIDGRLEVVEQKN